MYIFLSEIYGFLNFFLDNLNELECLGCKAEVQPVTTAQSNNKPPTTCIIKNKMRI